MQCKVVTLQGGRGPRDEAARLLVGPPASVELAMSVLAARSA